VYTKLTGKLSPALMTALLNTVSKGFVTVCVLELVKLESRCHLSLVHN
jgi:hypothetical protein